MPRKRAKKGSQSVNALTISESSPPTAQHRVMHTDEGKYCAFCTAVGTPTHRLKRCNGCEMTYFCNDQCQKNHWKVHKAYCRNRQEVIMNMPPGASDIWQELTRWARHNSLLLTVAGHQSLLPGVGYLEEPIYKTHLVHAFLDRTPTGFSVSSTKIELIEDYLRNYPYGELKSYAELMEESSQIVEQAKRFGSGMVGDEAVGVLRVVLMYEYSAGRPVGYIHPAVVYRSSLDHWKQAVHDSDWEGTLKRLVKDHNRLRIGTNGQVLFDAEMPLLKY